MDRHRTYRFPIQTIFDAPFLQIEHHLDSVAREPSRSFMVEIGFQFAETPLRSVLVPRPVISRCIAQLASVHCASTELGTGCNPFRVHCDIANVARSDHAYFLQSETRSEHQYAPFVLLIECQLLRGDEAPSVFLEAARGDAVKEDVE